MKFKGMRSALLAVGALAALIGTAQAQTRNPSVDFRPGFTELVFDSFISVPGSGTPTATPPPGIPGSFDVYGTFQSGSGLLPNYPGAFGTIAETDFTFGLTGLAFSGINPAPGANSGLVFSGGSLTIYHDPGAVNDTNPSLPLPQAIATFTNGTPILTGNVTVFSNVDASGEGGYSGNIVFTGSPNNLNTIPFGGTYNGNLFNDFLAANAFAIIQGSQQTAGAGGTPFGAVSTGNVNVIPEPTTMALFGAGLLPLGAFLRRRRGA